MARASTFRGIEIKIPPEGTWYNLASGHNLKTQAKAKEGFIFLDNPRVAGSPELISEFQTENSLTATPFAPASPMGRQLTFAGKTFNEPNTGYYNLHTGRVVKNIPAGFVTSETAHVVGEPNVVESFRQENRLLRPEPIHPQETVSTILHGQKEPIMPVQPGVGLSRSEAAMLVPTLFTLPAAAGITPFGHLLAPALRGLAQPRLEAIAATYPQFEVQTCNPRDIGTVLALQTEDIEKVSLEDLDKLCSFTLARIKTKARVMNVIDGDTFDLAFIVNMTTLTEPRELRTRGRLEKMQPVLAFPESQGFAMRMNCRLYGADAYEKETPQGIVAKRFMTDRLAEHKNIAFVVFRDFDKYGRPLVDLFTQPDFTGSYAQMLLDYTDPQLGKVAEPYFGGTKSEKAKALVKEARQI